MFFNILKNCAFYNYAIDVIKLFFDETDLESLLKVF